MQPLRPPEGVLTNGVVSLRVPRPGTRVPLPATPLGKTAVWLGKAAVASCRGAWAPVRRTHQHRYSVQFSEAMARIPKMKGQPLASMAETMRVRAGDFFVRDEHAAIGINGGYPPVNLLNAGMLDDVRSDSLPL